MYVVYQKIVAKDVISLTDLDGFMTWNTEAARDFGMVGLMEIVTTFLIVNPAKRFALNPWDEMHVNFPELKGLVMDIIRGGGTTPNPKHAKDSSMADALGTTTNLTLKTSA